MQKKEFIRTRESTSRIVDADLKISNSLILPDADANGDPVAGAIAAREGKLVLHNGEDWKPIEVEVDTVPKKDSKNPVQSGAVYTALGNKSDTGKNPGNINDMNEIGDENRGGFFRMDFNVTPIKNYPDVSTCVLVMQQGNKIRGLRMMASYEKDDFYVQRANFNWNQAFKLVHSGNLDSFGLVTQSGAKTYVSLTYNATTNTYSGNLAPAITGYTVGMAITVRVPSANNSTNTQIALNGLASVQIYKNNGSSLAAGDLLPGYYTLVYGANAAFYLQGGTAQAIAFSQVTGQPADNPNLKTALDGKVNATGANTAMASTEDGRVSFLDRTGQLLQSTWLKFVNATRELTIGDAANPGKLTVFSNVFKLQVQDNIGDGQASIVINALQDKAFQIVDKLGNVYMIFRTLASGAGVVISKLWIFDQNVGSPLYRAQAAVTSNGAGTKIYATKGDAANTAYSIDMNVDTQVCGLNFRMKVYDATGNKIIHAKWEGTLKRIGGVISVTGTPESKTLCDNGTSGFAFGVEPKADNSGLLLFFTPGAGDTTPYTGSFYDINYSF